MKTNKKEKLKQLLVQLNSLKGAKTDEVSQLTDSMIQEEIASLASKLQGNPTIKILQNFSKELTDFKKNFDLKPILSSVKGLQDELTASEQTLVSDFEAKLRDLTKMDAETDAQNLSAIRTEFTSKIEALNIPSLKKGLDDFKSQLSKMEDDDMESDLKLQTQIEEDFNSKLQELRKDLMTKVGSLGGGSMNRRIMVGGVDYLTRYTDINIKAGSNLSIAVVNNDTTKQVDITFTAAGGGANFETPVGTVNDSNLTFTVSHTPVYINVNGAQYTAGLGIFASFAGGTITLTSPVGTGGFIISSY